MKKLHVVGAAVVLALAAAPHSRHRATDPLVSRRRLDGTVLRRRSPGHQPDRSDGDRHRPRLPRRRRGGRPDRDPAPPPDHPAGQPAARPRHRRDVGAGRHERERRPDLRRADDVLEQPPRRAQRRRRRGAADDVVPRRGRDRQLLQHVHPAGEPEPQRRVGDGATAERRRRAGRLPLHRRRQQPPDDPGQQPAAVPQRQLRDGRHRLAAGLRRARHVLARLPGWPRRDRRRQPVDGVALRRGLHGRRLRDLLPARQHHRRVDLVHAELLHRQRGRHHQDRPDRGRTAAAPSACATTPSWWTRPSPRPSRPARRSSPSGRCTGAASSRATRPRA